MTNQEVAATIVAAFVADRKPTGSGDQLGEWLGDIYKAVYKAVCDAERENRPKAS
jgi:hypothetical protein